MKVCSNVSRTNFILLTFFCFFSLLQYSKGQSFSQKPVPVLVYANLGYTIGGQTGFSGVDLVINESWSASVAYTGSSRNSANTPADYHSNFTILFSSPFIKESLQMWQFTVGKVWRLSPQKRARFNLKAGLGLGQYRTPVNFVKTDSWFFENYTHSLKEQKIAGLLFQPTFELPVGQGFGFSLGFDANINKHWKIYGLRASINPGYFSGKRPARK